MEPARICLFLEKAAKQVLLNLYRKVQIEISYKDLNRQLRIY